MQFRIRTLLVVTALIAIACVPLLRFFEPTVIKYSEEAKVLAAELTLDSGTSVVSTERAIGVLGKSQHSVVFLNLDWSANSIIGSYQFAQWKLDYPDVNPDVECKILDITPITSDYSPLDKLADWTQFVESGSHRSISGNGEIVWIVDQRVVHVQSVWDFRSTSELNDLTHKLMQDH